MIAETSYMSDKDFVSFLVDETLKLQKSGDVGLSSLELKLTDYGLNFLKGEFIPQTQILRFTTPFGNLDVPVNWSIFSVENSLAQYTLLDEKNDVDSFFSSYRGTTKPRFWMPLLPDFTSRTTTSTL